MMDIRTHIPMDGAYNVRHLGGFPTRDGAKTRMYAFIRGESPVDFTARDVVLLLKLGVRTVIDLREMDEISSEPGPFPSVPTIDLHSIPLLGQDASPGAMAGCDMRELYIHILENRKQQLNRALRVILAANRSVFFHCTAGKDRTGVLAAVLLLTAGVPPGAVVEEYCFTQALLAPWVERRTARHGKEMGQFEANPEYIRAALQHIFQRYHDITGYLQSAGLGMHEIAVLRSRICNPQPAPMLRGSSISA